MCFSLYIVFIGKGVLAQQQQIFGTDQWLVTGFDDSNKQWAMKQQVYKAAMLHSLSWAIGIGEWIVHVLSLKTFSFVLIPNFLKQPSYNPYLRTKKLNYKRKEIKNQKKGGCQNFNTKLKKRNKQKNRKEKIKGLNLKALLSLLSLSTWSARIGPSHESSLFPSHHQPQKEVKH